MTALELAECLFDEAEREKSAARNAACSYRDLEAERHRQRSRECQLRANQLLEQVMRPNYRVAV
jgi:hypothetical protein